MTKDSLAIFTVIGIIRNISEYLVFGTCDGEERVNVIDSESRNQAELDNAKSLKYLHILENMLYALKKRNSYV